MRSHNQPALYEYIDTTFTQETPLLAHVRGVGESLVPGMQISAYEGKMLSVFITMIGAKHILEIGTFVGYSALWMAQALDTDGTITTLEANADNASLAKAHFAQTMHSDQFTLIEGKALKTLEILAKSKPVYDAVFIDAAKSEYPNYLEYIIPMLRQGGLIIADNTLLFGHMYNEPKRDISQTTVNAMKNFNSALANPVNFNSILLPTIEGLTIAVKL